MNLRYIAHLDTFKVNAQLCRLVSGDLWEGETKLQTMMGPRNAHKTLMLRTQDPPSPETWFDDRPQLDHPVLATWGSMRRMLKQARTAIEADPIIGPTIDKDAELGRVVISVMAPGQVMNWHTDIGDYAQKHLRFHVALTTCPGCILYCGGEQTFVQIGSLIYLNALAQHCAINLGNLPRAHLVFELRRKDAGPLRPPGESSPAP